MVLPAFIPENRLGLSSDWSWVELDPRTGNPCPQGTQPRWPPAANPSAAPAVAKPKSTGAYGRTQPAAQPQPAPAYTPPQPPLPQPSAPPCPESRQTPHPTSVGAAAGAGRVEGVGGGRPASPDSETDSDSDFDIVESQADSALATTSSEGTELVSSPGASSSFVVVADEKEEEEMAGVPEELREAYRSSAQKLAAERAAGPLIEGECGLENPVGANNCFLNVVLQALWHMPSFREEFVAVCGSGHKCSNTAYSGNKCILCSLQELFVQYRYGEYQHLPPKHTRVTVARVFKEESRFQLGQQDDASELLVHLLDNLHSALHPDGEICNPKCLIHRTFGTELTEGTIPCQFCNTGPALVSSLSFAHYFPAQMLTDAHQTFEEVMKKHWACDPKTCNECQPARPVKSFKYIITPPKVFLMSVAWNSETSSKAEVASVINYLPDSLRLAEMFESPADVSLPVMQRTGIICYYGHHYVCYFRTTTTGPSGEGRLSDWVYFDDSRVRKVGDWDGVVTAIISSQQQPLVIFYSV